MHWYEWKNKEQMVCVTAFPAAAAFRCFNTASSPVTTNFTLTHLRASVHLSVVFQGNWNGIHSCRAMEKININPLTKRIHSRKSDWLNFCLVKQCIYFQWPDACRSNLFEGRWTCGRMRHKQGALFWLKHTPFPFTTIQPLSYSKPRGPTGQSWTCMKNSTETNQNRGRDKTGETETGIHERRKCLGYLQTSCAPHDLMGYM